VLRDAGLDVTVIDHEEVLWPGAARNVGIKATRAPLVAFLAADCLAEPGWVRERLAAHRGGARAVAGCVTQVEPRKLASIAFHILMYARRMPGTPPGQRLHYSLSYDRNLFERYGLFSEDLRSGEDTDFNSRLRSDVAVTWAGDVRTAHRHPTGVVALLRDMWRRGNRMAKFLEHRGQASRWRVAWYSLRRLPFVLRLAAISSDPAERRRMWLAWPLTPLASLSYALGAATAGTPVPLRPNAPRPKAARRIRIIGLLAFRDEMRYLPGYFRNVTPLLDGIVALDDGSTDGSGEFVAAQPIVLEVISRPRTVPHEWDDAGNHRLLIEAALKYGPAWLIGLDADERLERSFRRRARRWARRGELLGRLSYRVWIRSVWGAPDTYRVDGPYGQVTAARFFKARSDHEFDPRRFHGQWAPLNSRIPGTNSHYKSNLIIFHLRMMTKEDRLARYEKHKALDPDLGYQPEGYDHMIDESGLRLKRIPWRRRYRPSIPPRAGP